MPGESRGGDIKGGIWGMGRKAWLDGGGSGRSCCVREIAHIFLRVKVTKGLRGEWGRGTL